VSFALSSLCTGASRQACLPCWLFGTTTVLLLVACTKDRVPYNAVASKRKPLIGWWPWATHQPHLLLDIWFLSNQISKPELPKDNQRRYGTSISARSMASLTKRLNFLCSSVGLSTRLQLSSSFEPCLRGERLFTRIKSKSTFAHRVRFRFQPDSSGLFRVSTRLARQLSRQTGTDQTKWQSSGSLHW
jgi:hypothetical protein